MDIIAWDLVPGATCSYVYVCTFMCELNKVLVVIFLTKLVLSRKHVRRTLKLESNNAIHTPQEEKAMQD
jgi:hypothetical protein